VKSGIQNAAICCNARGDAVKCGKAASRHHHTESVLNLRSLDDTLNSRTIAWRDFFALTAQGMCISTAIPKFMPRIIVAIYSCSFQQKKRLRLLDRRQFTYWMISVVKRPKASSVYGCLNVGSWVPIHFGYKRLRLCYSIHCWCRPYDMPYTPSKVSY
jgi:hypothetical protein